MSFLALILLVFISSCAVKTWQVEGPSQLSNGLSIKVDTKAWSYSPSNLTSYVLPVYLEIKNLSKEPVKVSRDDIYLIDDKGNQINPLEPRDVMALVQRSYGSGISLGFGYYSYPFGVWWHPYYYFPPSTEVYPDIINYAFTFGTIESQAVLKGFVYFPKPQAESLTLKVKAHSFKLKREEK